MSNFLTAEWRKLVMVNYAVEPSLLLPYLPPHTELDLWNNTCYVSLVGFMFLNTRVKGIKIPFHVNFEEVNLRFYVTRNDPKTGPKRGVVFIQEIVPRRMVSFVANTSYRENYVTLPMRHTWAITPDALSIDYAFQKNNEWFHFGVTATNSPQPLIADSEEEFITEHFWGYSKWNSTSTNEYEVGHPRWHTYPVTSSALHLDFAKIYGTPFAFLNHTPPRSVFLAEGSEIFLRKGARIGLK